MTSDTSSTVLQSPPSTPVHQLAANVPCALPTKDTVISPLLPLPLLSPQTQQLVQHNPQLAGFIAQGLTTTCLQLINNNNQSPALPGVITSNTHTPSVAVTQEIATVHAEANKELSETLIVPSSPPMCTDNADIPSLCESPPLISSPVKQPLTSTQINDDYETRELNLLSVSCANEALDDTETVKQEQHNTVVSLSSQGIVLPSNLTGCNQTNSTINATVNDDPPEQRRSLRKRSNQRQMDNVRHAKKRQHRKQVCSYLYIKQRKYLWESYSIGFSTCLHTIITPHSTMKEK